MKKLMIAAAIVCAAAFAQAASYGWTFTNFDSVESPDGRGGWSGQMTIACVDLGFQGNIEVADGNFFYEFYIDCQQGTSYTFVLTGKDGNYAYSQSASGSAEYGFGSATFAGGNAWTAVPEPTSGLLMLLGIAGLALRRKSK